MTDPVSVLPLCKHKPRVTDDKPHPGQEVNFVSPLAQEAASPQTYDMWNRKGPPKSLSVKAQVLSGSGRWFMINFPPQSQSHPLDEEIRPFL